MRPLGSVVYFLPPYVITPEQIDFLAEVASEGIDIATATRSAWRSATSTRTTAIRAERRRPFVPRAGSSARGRQ